MTGDSIMVLPPCMVVVFYGRGVGIMYLQLQEIALYSILIFDHE